MSKFEEDFAHLLLERLGRIEIGLKTMEGKVMSVLDDLKASVDVLATAVQNENDELQKVVTDLLAGPHSADPAIQEQVTRLQAIIGNVNSATQAAKDATKPNDGLPADVKVEATGTVQ